MFSNIAHLFGFWSGLEGGGICMSLSRKYPIIHLFKYLKKIGDIPINQTYRAMSATYVAVEFL